MTYVSFLIFIFCLTRGRGKALKPPPTHPQAPPSEKIPIEYAFFLFKVAFIKVLWITDDVPAHCLISSRGGQGTTLQIMALATIDRQWVRKCTPSFTKSPSLVLIDPILSEIQPFKNVKIYKEMCGHPDDHTSKLAWLTPNFLGVLQPRSQGLSS